jgi:hypothetical protein
MKNYFNAIAIVTAVAVSASIPFGVPAHPPMRLVHKRWAVWRKQ